MTKTKAIVSDGTWSVLPAAARKLPGSPLLALLLAEAATRGISIRTLAKDHMNVSHSHLLLLRKGQRSIPRLGPEVMDNIARFLRLPKVVVMLAGGQLTIEDFLPDPSVLNNVLEPALKFMQRDPEFGAYMPPTAFTADVRLRYYMILLYEKATGRVLIPSRTSIADIMGNYGDHPKGRGTRKRAAAESAAPVSPPTMKKATAAS